LANIPRAALTDSLAPGCYKYAAPPGLSVRGFRLRLATGDGTDEQVAENGTALTEHLISRRIPKVMVSIPMRNPGNTKYVKNISDLKFPQSPIGG
jgi:hypothetical protein